MKDSDLSANFSAAHRAMLLVSRGVSEREAVSRALVTNRNMVRERDKILSLVLQTVTQQDLLDRLVETALPGEKLSVDALSWYRLAANIVLQTRGKTGVESVERQLRSAIPVEYRAQFELLIGNVQALDPNNSSRDLQNSERVSLLTNHPSWWVEYCFRTFGRGEGIQILSANSRLRYVRVNPLKNRGRTSLPRNLRDSMGQVIDATGTPNVYSLSGSLTALSKFFSQGLFQMQDLASFLAVKAADPKPGEKVLELCAAPGAKTAAVAQLMKNRGQIVSIDYSRIRMRTWKHETVRLGVKIAEPVIADATRIGLRHNFDLIVVDPPCTGTGILDRNPSMKWRLSSRALERYAALQRHTLDSAAGLVERNGRILYCTCSLTVEENEMTISAFLKSHAEFETQPVLQSYGAPGLRGMSDCRRFYPHRDRTAGYFIALMQKMN